MKNIKALREARKAQGLCVICGQPADHYRCPQCAEKHSTYYTIMNLRGICKDCGKPLDRKGVYCIDCCQKIAIRQKERNALRRANHQCVACGAPTDGHYVKCRKCLDKTKEYKKRHGN